MVSTKASEGVIFCTPLATVRLSVFLGGGHGLLLKKQVFETKIETKGSEIRNLERLYTYQQPKST
jgi:hypothetical protein